ncbi:MAG: acetyl-CoA carboxylase carboxyltransferase subunit alpha [Chitinivibrionales bacterium]|nr:acetyl-CoA carboxylase carboxyltransferase subunit alpha [Chitinivibrionales bacterium]MBD3356813.1 acetyl-CoA carboxylase carboxyltransferase subunit alpha [Chitinivibrionales bacterium]
MEPSFDFEKPILEIERMIDKLKKLGNQDDDDHAARIAELEEQCLEQKKKIYSNLTPWQTVQIARHPKRPVLQDYIQSIFTDFVELHGDRLYGDDRALIGGFATIGKKPVMLVGQNKGKNIEENLERNFAMSNPEGYRKALRLMRLAEQFELPVVTLIDTPAAYPGKEAEERGQAEAIAKNLAEMARLETPIVTVVLGEGGSGGAIGIGVADVVMMLSYSIYSVIPPEGCAAILWRDAAKAPEAAESLKLTAQSLLDLGVTDEIIDEPLGGAHHDPATMTAAVKKAVLKHLRHLKGTSGSKLVSKRFEKYSKIGEFYK